MKKVYLCLLAFTLVGISSAYSMRRREVKEKKEEQSSSPFGQLARDLNNAVCGGDEFSDGLSEHEDDERSKIWQNMLQKRSRRHGDNPSLLEMLLAWILEEGSSFLKITDSKILKDGKIEVKMVLSNDELTQRTTEAFDRFNDLLSSLQSLRNGIRCVIRLPKTLYKNTITCCGYRDRGKKLKTE